MYLGSWFGQGDDIIIINYNLLFQFCVFKRECQLTFTKLNGIGNIWLGTPYDLAFNYVISFISGYCGKIIIINSLFKIPMS